MIPLSEDFDLAKDRTRIKDKRDGERQRRTAEELLSRFFHDDPEQRWELQLVADEVGMGKTFVALAVAYSVLRVMRAGERTGDFDGCAPRVLIIAPQMLLANKWVREVGEFVRRCVHEEFREEASGFNAKLVDRLDDLAMHLRSSDGPSVIVTQMSVLASGKKFKDLDLKRRVLLGVIFRYWGNRFSKDARERLLRGAPESWPRDPDALARLENGEPQRLPFKSVAEMRECLERSMARPVAVDSLEALLVACREISEPFVRGRDERFAAILAGLSSLYTDVCFAGVEHALPLVVVDEAHNWKNGPRDGANGYRGFESRIAALTRRALLLTATPFQLRPEEVLELLHVGTVLSPSPDRATCEARRTRTEAHRSNVIGPVLEAAAFQSRVFAGAWGRLSPQATQLLADNWSSAALVRVRTTLREAAHLAGRVDARLVARLSEEAVVGRPLELRDVLREGLRLYAYNEDLSQELGAFVIRHRRRTDHRLFHVGSEFTAPRDSVMNRADRSTLHAAAGMDVHGDAELPHYLLMRCVSEMKRGKGRSALGTALTGCYSTLLQSADGKAIQKKLGDGVGKKYLELLLAMVTEDKDAEHPKVRAVLDATVRAWRAGEKTLLFCFRTHTARRLQQLLDRRIEDELHSRRDAVLGGAESLKALRSRFTRRDGDLVTLGLDRVLWSLRWAAWSDEVALPELIADDLRLTDKDLEPLARLALVYGVDLRDERVDRVFVHRAVEHLVGRRLRSSRGGGLFRSVLDSLADESWVRAPYGLERSVDDGSDAEEPVTNDEAAGLDERGVHVAYAPSGSEPSAADVRQLADDLRERRERARRQGQVSVFDAYAEAPSFWLGPQPEALIQGDPGAAGERTLSALHAHLLALTRTDQILDWKQRRLVLQGLRRALMRESVVLRILPERSELAEGRWGDLLVEQFFAPLPDQRESMADRLAVFVEDLQAAAGPIEDVGTARNAMYEATRMRDTGFVVLVDGSTLPERRERVFAGFNSPLLPEILICTSVGQEGIDLHRHCRNVIHYDLAWNPAVLEQRTGRVDRIGSKTFRERAATDAPDGARAFLDVGVPFLAGTYDERMYEEIRIRAQTFEVLTGGDVAADNLEGGDEGDGAEGKEAGLQFPVLPPEMIRDLRVRLHVWEPAGEVAPMAQLPEARQSRFG
jgi:hypothetical protein